MRNLLLMFAAGYVVGRMNARGETAVQAIQSGVAQLKSLFMAAQQQALAPGGPSVIGPTADESDPTGGKLTFSTGMGLTPTRGGYIQ